MTCWEYNNCPKEGYENCPAYPANGRNCWTVTEKKYDKGKSEALSFLEKLYFCKNNCNFFKTHVRSF
jgi:hypothetical protein